MGILFSRNHSTDLYERLEKLEKLDINNDGIISKEEFERWKNNDLVIIKNNIKDDIKREYENKLLHLNDTISNLNKEILSLQYVNKDLETSLKNKNNLIEKLGSNINNDTNVNELLSLLSREHINKYVEEMLMDEETNIKFLPDVVERQIYRNVFRLSIKLINKILNTMSFQMVGHKLHMSMIPK